MKKKVNEECDYISHRHKYTHTQTNRTFTNDGKNEEEEGFVRQE